MRKHALVVLLVLLMAGVLYPVIARALDAAAIFRMANPSVVLVVAINKGKRIGSQGSGFFVDNGTKVVTNRHVIAGMTDVGIKQGNDIIWLDSMVSVAPSRDIAVLTVSGSGPSLKLAKQEPSVGEEIVTIGSPMGLENTVSKGEISGIRQNCQVNTDCYQLSAPITHGSSGGPMLNARGEVVGITTWGVETAGNLNFAIPSKYIAELLNNPNYVEITRVTSVDANISGHTTGPTPGGGGKPIEVEEGDDGSLIFK